MSRKKMLAVLPCAALCAALPGKAPAQQHTGVVAVRDAQSGQLRAPTAGELRALAPAPTASLQGTSAPALVTHPNGARQVRLGERGLVYAVATRRADGSVEQQCVQGLAAAQASVAAGAGAAQQQPQHEHQHQHEHEHEQQRQHEQQPPNTAREAGHD